MSDLKLELELVTDNASKEIVDFSEQLKFNIKGVEISIKEDSSEAKEKKHMGAEYLPIVEMVLTSTVVTAVAKGIYLVIKDLIDIKKQKNQLEADKSKVIIKKTNKEGVIEEFILHLFTDEERNKLIDFLKK